MTSKMPHTQARPTQCHSNFAETSDVMPSGASATAPTMNVHQRRSYVV